MKKLFYIFAVATVFVACKGKSENDLNANKEIISLTDSTFYNSNYLTDTGAVSNPEDFTGGAVVSGKATVAAKPAPARRSSSGAGTYNNSGSSSKGSTASSGTGTTATPARRKGMSKSAQGAIIGGVGGAVAGAVIGKGKGAVIGGVVGAAGGYIIGRSKDKRDGRVQ